MTFVAQPYQQFVDDLLTALTGGVIREEHQFVTNKELYSLASSGVIAVSVKVFGQQNDTFLLFERGIDYDYNTEQEAIIWKGNGRVPDDHTFFYVNYYLQEGQRRLTDRNPGSVTTTLAEAFAREFAVLHKQMELIYQSAFVDLATGPSLDHVAALLALSRKDARFASGEVLFKRSTPAPGDITIAAGTLVSTDQGQNFVTTDKRTLREGQLSVTASISAQVEGLVGRVTAGNIKNINRPIFGIETVINQEDTSFAIEKETDEELRRRIKGTLERAGKSTLNAIKYSLIEEIPGINEGNLQVIESTEVPGKVEIKFGLSSAVDADLVRRIEESIFNSRAAGVRVVHNLPTRTKTESAKRAEARNNDITREMVVTHFSEIGEPQVAIHLPLDLLNKMAEGILDLSIEILLRLTEQNLSASQKEKIEDEVRTRVVDYIEALPMGEDLVYNKLLGRIVEPEGIADAILLIRVASENRISIYRSNLATDGRKAKVDAKNVVVGLMEESIFIEILVWLKTGEETRNGAKVTQELDTAIKNAVDEILTATRGKLLKADLRMAISSAVEEKGGGLQLIEGNAVIMNAEYEESGRLLNNTEEVSLESNNVLELRQLSIEIKGALDG
jgi:uncharacterized phage protein gp47/JayE